MQSETGHFTYYYELRTVPLPVQLYRAVVSTGICPPFALDLPAAPRGTAAPTRAPRRAAAGCAGPCDPG